LKTNKLKNDCKECGVCVDVCPIHEYDENYIVYKIFFDINSEFKLWTRCCSCFLCEENCPYELSPREFIFEKRRESKKQAAPDRINEYLKKITKIGFSFEITDFINEIREDMDLYSFDYKKIKNDIHILFEY